MRNEGWSSPWADRAEPRRRGGVVDEILERQERARGRAYRRRREARRLAAVAVVLTLAGSQVPYGWVGVAAGAVAGSRAVWVWLRGATDAFEGSLDVRDVLVEAEV